MQGQEQDQAPQEEIEGPSAGQLRKQAWQTMGLVSGLGMQFVAVVGASVWFGVKADDRLGTGPWLTLVGALVGVAAAALMVWRLMRLLKRRQRERGAEQ